MIKKIQTTNVFDRNYNSIEPVIINIGGSRSGKSYSILQLFLMKFINEDNKEFMIARKTLPALRRTAYKVFINMLQEYGYYKHCDHNKTDLTIKFKNNVVEFLSVDNIEKIKSSEYNYIFLEEANEFTELDYRIIHTRLSGQTIPSEPNKYILSLNPSDIDGWINETLVHESGVEIIKSSYLDNPFLSDEYIKILTDLKEKDPALYRIYALGLWAEMQGKIYSNYVIEPVFPETFDDEIQSIDFGYNNPSAVMWIGFKDNELYIRELIYQTKLTNKDLIDKMVAEVVSKKTQTYADSAEPDRIEEIHRAGFNILPARKGPGSVFTGINAVKSHKMHVHESATFFIKELKSHLWKKDKNGKNLDEPVKYNDHACDAVRMGVFTYTYEPEQREIKFIPTSAGGSVAGRLRG